MERLIRLSGAAAIAFSMTVSAAAGADANEKARGDVWRKVLANTRPDEIRPEPHVPGLFEIVMGDKVVYGDATGRYLLFGHIYDVQTQQDITQQRIDEVNASLRIPWDSIPLEHAIREGERLAPPDAPKLAVLFSPQCPWCRKLYHDIKSEKDKDGTITRKGLEFQVDARILILAPPYFEMRGDPERMRQQFVRKVAEYIVCGLEPNLSLKRAMEDDFLEQFAKDLDAGELVVLGGLMRTRGCKAEEKLGPVRRFAQKHGLTSTPVLISGDGRVHRGYLPPDRLRAWLREGRSASQAAEKQEVTGQ